jgi:hypothetical protein
MANKLSNYGDTLKLLVPSNSRKAICGWTNHSGTVISQKIKETEMGYRVSKSSSSINLDKGVKEQRVDGSWCLIKSYPNPRREKQRHLRYTLMGLERDYQIGIPSKQLKLSYSTSYKTLNPYFITGFTDAEGCFTVTIFQDLKMKTEKRVSAYFKIGLNERDLDLLKQIQNFFGGIGNIYYNPTSKSWTYRVNKISDLDTVIIPHFIKYSLLSQKAADFNLFVQIVQLLKENAHLSKTGLEQIMNVKYSLNKNLVSSKEIIKTTKITDPHWIAGFVSGEGNFDAGTRKATVTPTHRNERAYLRFRITQHERDLNLMGLITNYLGAGRIEKDKRVKNSTVTIVVGSLSDITNKIIPFFDKYTIHGIKYLDYLDWVRISNLMQIKNKESMNEIKRIEKGMNSSRKK